MFMKDAKDGEEGSISIVTMSVLFHGEQLTHHAHHHDPKLEELLSNLYCILIRRASSPQVVAGMMIKSTMSDTKSDEFRGMMTDLLARCPPLKHLANDDLRFRPARIRFEGAEPLSEEECLRVMAQQFYNFNTQGGNA